LRIRTFLAGCALLAPLASAFAQSSVSFSSTPITVGTSSAQAGSAHQRRHLEVLNQSATATVYCTLDGGTAVAAPTAGHITLPPLSGFVWGTGIVPANALNCIATGATTPVTIVE
jgi:hypothetical protein